MRVSVCVRVTHAGGGAVGQRGYTNTSTLSFDYSNYGSERRVD